ncbi:inverse autotransporter beta-barrel domain-containing protein [Xenorhabdus beddingii]|uniref:Inverse autotransporter beta-barrel domain-containing protein n=1 Tax=Xenorhabdus beddingii TaxID=40578 RepID=A0A1Y2SJR0_9GAMM|nr:hypothetical protein [Xenorhabdus beddingii]OTA19143.1 inverse autotransporter beta-barrel domain-containing protein [Xenorhabdus beddingii]
MSTEKYFLDAPILPQAKNGVLDKSEIQGKIEIIVPQYQNNSEGDTIHLYFGSEKKSITHTLNHLDDITFYFNKDEIPEGNYVVSYSVTDISQNAIKSHTTNIQVVDHVTSSSFGKNCFPAQCVEDVDSISLPVDFEITNVEIYAVEINGSNEMVSQDTSLIANGTDKYKYRALISKKGSNGNDPIINHTFNNVEWTRDQSQINNTDLPQPQPDEKSPTKTDYAGYLYATLYSNVGVYNDIVVTLTMGEGSVSKDSDNTVSFIPIAQKAVMYVYNINREKEIYKIFQEPQPYNFFNNLAAKLRPAKNPNIDFDTSELTYNFKTTFPNGYTNVVDIGKDSKGPLTFDQYGKVIIQAVINKDDGTCESYEYKLNLGRALIFTEGKNLYFPAKDSTSCENINPDSSAVSLSIDDFQKNDKGIAINNEFKNLYEWGLFGNNEQIKNDLRFKVRGKDGAYIIYDAIKNEIDNSHDAKGLIICTKK